MPEKSCKCSSCSAPPNPNEVLSIQRVVQEYGLTTWMVRSLIWGRQIAFIEIGRKQFIQRRDLEDFLTAHRRTA